MNNDEAQRLSMEQSWDTRLDSAKCLLAAFEYLGIPESLLDVGCGKGHLVVLSASLGVIAGGVDIGSKPILSIVPGISSYSLGKRDLTEPDDSLTEREMVLCWEVAEHLPPESADTLCDTLANATDKWLLFSAATPGQGGSGHLNEQPHEYWIEKLENRGLIHCPTLTATLSLAFRQVEGESHWYGNNIRVFGAEQ